MSLVELAYKHGQIENKKIQEIKPVERIFI